MIKKTIALGLISLFALGAYIATASSAIAVIDTNEEYVEINAQSLQVSPTAETPDATRDTFEIEMKSVVRHPVDNATISSGYGYRLSACRGCSNNHQGVDYTPGRGTPIYAIADGTITQSGYAGSYGESITIQHTINGQRIESLYAHMQNNSRRYTTGQTIRMGDIIGTVGSTGISTGPHVHFEIRLDGTTINPQPWLNNNINAQAWDHLQ